MVPEDVQVFSEKVYQLLTNKKLHKEKSQEGKQWSHQWSIATLTDKLISAYKKCVRIHNKRADYENA